jgi:RNA recognition motif-containing protein
MNIYVGNLSREAGEMQLKSLFAEFGEVRSVKIIKDKETGESRGFAFIEMPDDTQAQAAIREVDSKEFLRRRLKVNEANPKNTSARVYNSFSSSYGYKNRNVDY